jgi:hypothetical protein
MKESLPILGLGVFFVGVALACGGSLAVCLIVGGLVVFLVGLGAAGA